MNRIQCIIVDDENSQIENLARELNKFYEKIEIFKRYNNIEKFLTEQKNIKYDVVFLDIEMGNTKKGIDITKDVKDIVFVSAFHKEYYLEIFNIINSSEKILGFINKANLENEVKNIIDKLYLHFNQRSDYLFLNFEPPITKVKQDEIMLITTLPKNENSNRKDKRLLKIKNGNLSSFEWITIRNENLNYIIKLLDINIFFQINEHFIIHKNILNNSQINKNNIFILLSFLNEFSKDKKTEIERKLDLELEQRIAENKKNQFELWKLI